MDIRLDLLEHATKTNKSFAGIKQVENIDQIEGTQHALEILKLLIDRAGDHFREHSHHDGFMMSHQDFLALNYLKVEHQVL